MQREGQARSPTKSESDSANVKPYKHTQTLALRKAGGIVRFFEESMLVQLYRYTHENINALSVRKVFSAVLVQGKGIVRF